MEIIATKGQKIIEGTSEADVITVPAVAGKNITVNAGAGDDEINVYGTGHTIEAGAGKDTVNLLGGASHKVLAGAGDDTIVVNGAKNVKLELGGGNDSVKLENGSIATLQMDAGQNKVIMEAGTTITTIHGGTGTNELQLENGKLTNYYGSVGVDTLKLTGTRATKLLLEAGDDSFTANGAIVSRLEAGAGNDQITVDNSTVTSLYLNEGTNKVSVEGGTVKNIYAGTGLDTITVDKYGTVNVLKADAYNATQEVLELEGVAKNVSLGAGDDVIKSVGGTMTTVNLGDGNDNMTLQNGSVKTLSLGNGDDTVTLENSNATTIKLNSGTNTLNLNDSTVKTLSGGTGHNIIKMNNANVTKLTGSTGVDELTLEQVTNQKANLGDGNDVLTAIASDNINITAGAGDDVLTVTGGTNITLAGGKGNDTYVITELQEDGLYTINNSGNALGNMDKLDLSAFSRNSFTFSVDAKQNLLLTYNNGAQIKLTGWNKNAMPIGFMDSMGYMSVEEINALVVKQLKLKATASGKGSAYSDIFTVLPGAKVNATISAASANDVLDLSEFKDSGLEFSLAAVNSNLQVLITKDGKSIGKVNLSGYLNSASPLEKVLLYDNELQATIEYKIEAKGGAYLLKPSFEGLSINGSGTYNVGAEEAVALYGKGAQVVLQGFKENMYLDLSSYGKEAQLIAQTKAGSLELKVVDKNTNEQLASLKLQNYGAKPLELATAMGKHTVITPSATEAVYALTDALDFTVAAGKQWQALAGTQLSDNLTIQGNVGNAATYDGQDSVKVEGGSVELLQTGANGDTVVVKNGSVHNLELGEGDDNLQLQGGSLGKVDLGNGNDKVELANGSVELLQLSSGDNTVNINGAVQAAIAGGSGNDKLTIKNSGNLVSLADGTLERVDVAATSSAATNTVNITGATVAQMKTGAGATTINVESGRVDELQLISGKDVLHISGGSVGKLILGSGDNTINLEGGSLEKLQNAGGTTTINVNSGENVQVDAGDGVAIINVNSGTGHVLKADKGNDTYCFHKLEANGVYIVDQRSADYMDKDIIDLSAFHSQDFTYQLKGTELVLTHSNGAQVAIKGWNGATVETIKFADGEINSNTQLFNKMTLGQKATALDTIQVLMGTLDATRKMGFAAMDEAVVNCSLGKYSSLKELVDAFINDAATKSSSNRDEAKAFLKEYCDVDMDNEDTGAITGADAGGPVVKNKESIVPEPEGMTVEDFVYDASQKSKFTDCSPLITGGIMSAKEFSFTEVDGLTFYWDDSALDKLPVKRELLEQIVGGITTTWASESMKLIEESYGISYWEKDNMAYKNSEGKPCLQIYFFHDENTTELARVQFTVPTSISSYATAKQVLGINTAEFPEIMTDVNGDGTGGFYTDRIIAHELVHAVMGATIFRFDALPKFFTEGIAELVHGIDEERASMIYSSVNPTLTATSEGKKLDYSEFMHRVLSVENANVLQDTYTYAAGYLLLRYLGKQVSDYSEQLAGHNATEILVGSSMVDDSLLGQDTPKLMVGYPGLQDASLSFWEGSGAVQEVAGVALYQEQARGGLESLQGAELGFADGGVGASEEGLNSWTDSDVNKQNAIKIVGTV